MASGWMNWVGSESWAWVMVTVTDSLTPPELAVIVPVPVSSPAVKVAAWPPSRGVTVPIVVVQVKDTPLISFPYWSTP